MTQQNINIQIIGERLKELRLKKGLTQRVVAENMGVSKPIMSQYESGQRLPSIPKLIRLADYFNVSLDYLCGRTEEER